METLQYERFHHDSHTPSAPVEGELMETWARYSSVLRSMPSAPVEGELMETKTVRMSVTIKCQPSAPVEGELMETGQASCLQLAGRYLRLRSKVN